MTNPRCCDTLIDYVTGKAVPNAGAEASRQAVEKVLVDEKGYAKTDIVVDAPIVVDIDGEAYRSVVDLVVTVEGQPVMAIRCAAGSLDSWEREIVAAARLYQETPLALAVASDGVNAVIWDGIGGKKVGEGLAAIPDKVQTLQMISRHAAQPLSAAQRRRESIFFRSYDTMKVNRPRQ